MFEVFIGDDIKVSIYETLSIIIAGFSIILSSVSLYIARSASNHNKNMFKRRGVIELYMAWQGTNQIDKNKIITPDVIKAVNALSLTASVWNHDVIDKEILYQSFWTPFRDLYENINQIDELLPGMKQTGRSYLTTDILKAYEGMKKYHLSKIDQTNI